MKTLICLLLLIMATFSVNASAENSKNESIQKELSSSHQLKLESYYQWFNVRANVFLNRFQATAHIVNYYRAPIFCRVSAVGFNQYLGRKIYSNMQGWIYPGNTMYVYVNGQFTHANANAQCRF